MTIAIGALWPWNLQQIADLWRWEKLSGLNPPLPPKPHAVILLSDSRWTYPHGPMDQGTKLFRLADDAGAVYSGHVQAGEDSLVRLAKWFKKGKVVKGSAKRTTGKLLMKAYQSRSRPKGSPLRVFVGVCSPSGPAQLLYFDSDKNFSPVALTGVKVLADQRTTEAFLNGLNEVIAEVIRESSDTTVDKATLSLAIALQDYVIGPSMDRTVGGKIQCAIIDKRGFQRMGLSRANADSSTVISPRLEDLRLYRPRREPRNQR